MQELYVYSISVFDYKKNINQEHKHLLEDKIFAYCKDTNGDNTVLLIKNFQPYFYLHVLSESNRMMFDYEISRLEKRWKCKIQKEHRSGAYGWTGKTDDFFERALLPVYKVTFNGNTPLKSFSYCIRNFIDKNKKKDVVEIGKNFNLEYDEFKLYEEKQSFEDMLTKKYNVKYETWIKVNKTCKLKYLQSNKGRIETNQCFVKSQVYEADVEDVETVECKDDFPPLKILAFDDENYGNSRGFPNLENLEDHCISCASTVSQTTNPDEMDLYIHAILPQYKTNYHILKEEETLMAKCLEMYFKNKYAKMCKAKIKSFKLFTFNNSIDCYNHWAKWASEEIDYDVIVSYNGASYDFSERIKKLESYESKEAFTKMFINDFEKKIPEVEQSIANNKILHNRTLKKIEQTQLMTNLKLNEKETILTPLKKEQIRHMYLIRKLEKQLQLYLDFRRMFNYLRYHPNGKKNALNMNSNELIEEFTRFTKRKVDERGENNELVHSYFLNFVKNMNHVLENDKRNEHQHMSKCKLYKAKLFEKSIATQQKKMVVRQYETEGRYHVDMFQQVKETVRSFSYKLDYIASKLLKLNKMQGVPYEKINGIYTGDIANKMDNDDHLMVHNLSKDLEEVLSKDDLQKLKQMKKTNVNKYHRFILFFALLCYNGVDTIITNLLFYNQNSIGLILSKSQITQKSIQDILYSGLTVKVESVFFHEANNNNFVIDVEEYKKRPYDNTKNKNKNKKKMEGARVIDPAIGYYPDNINLVLDYISLYPSIMIAYFICVSNVIDTVKYREELLKYKGDERIQVFRKRTDTGEILITDFTTNGLSSDDKYLQENVFIMKNENCIIPVFEKRLFNLRRKVKKLMAEQNELYLKTGDRKYLLKKLEYSIYEKAIKVIMNSTFGVQAGQGRVTKKEVGMAILSAGRTLNHECERLGLEYFDVELKKKYPHKNTKATTTYGDSVTEDTPILCLNTTENKVQYLLVSELGNGEWQSYHDTKEACPIRDNYQVWTDKGFTTVNRVIRHKTNKEILRVRTSNACVDVTPDHSLLDENAKKIKPTEVGTWHKLLHAPLYNNEVIQMLEVHAYMLGVKLYHGEHNDIPVDILNSNKTIKRAYLKGYLNQNLNEDTVYYYKLYHGGNKMLAAQLYYIAHTLGHHLYVSEKYIERVNDYFYNGTETLVLSIENIGTTAKDAYVYDLETENHHFSAGVGTMIVHNTDSVFFKMNNDFSPHKLEDLKIMWEEMELVCKYINKFMPIGVVLEKDHMYINFFIGESKKRYIATDYIGRKLTLEDKERLKDSQNIDDFFIKEMKISGMQFEKNDAMVRCKNGMTILAQQLAKGECTGEMMKQFLYDNCQQIVSGALTIDELKYSKKLNQTNYAEGSIQYKLISKIRERSPGSEPKMGEVLSFVYVEKENTNSDKKGDYAEDFEYAKKMNMKYNKNMYLSAFLSSFESDFGAFCSNIDAIQNFFENNKTGLSKKNKNGKRKPDSGDWSLEEKFKKSFKIKFLKN